MSSSFVYFYFFVFLKFNMKDVHALCFSNSSILIVQVE
ncbi:hypothetical protein AMTRI_Chr02g217320 [Amborella trichopoda]